MAGYYRNQIFEFYPDYTNVYPDFEKNLDLTFAGSESFGSMIHYLLTSTCVNNLPRANTQLRPDQELNSRPRDQKYDVSNGCGMPLYRGDQRNKTRLLTLRLCLCGWLRRYSPCSYFRWRRRLFLFRLPADAHTFSRAQHPLGQRPLLTQRQCHLLSLRVSHLHSSLTHSLSSCSKGLLFYVLLQAETKPKCR